MASTEVEFNPFLPEFHANPYPFYHRLRAADAVHQTPMGLWVLTRYDDVVTALRDPRFGREGFEQMLAAVYGDDTTNASRPRSMLFRDPPDHTRLRGLVSQAFTPRVIERMRSHIQEIVDRLLDRVQNAKAMDVIEDLAYPLPVTVICEMLDRGSCGNSPMVGRYRSEPRRDRDAVGRRGREAGTAGTPGHARLFPWDHPRAPAEPPRRPPQPADRRRGARGQADRGGAAHHVQSSVRRRPRNHCQPHRQRSLRPPESSRPARQAAREPDADSKRSGGAPSVRQSGPTDSAHHEHRRRARRPQDREGLNGDRRDRRSQSRSGSL